MSLCRAFFCLAFTLAAGGPALAATNDYGGHDIADPVPQGQAAYSEVRGWRVFASEDGGKFASCFAEKDRGDGSIIRLGWDGLQWQLAVPLKSRPDWEGTLQVDGAGSGRGYRSGGDVISGTAKAGWTIAWLGEAELDGLSKGSEAVLGVGKADFDFSLAGATAAKLKVQECGQRSGKGGSAAAAPAASRVARFGMAGSWAINELREGKHTIACEAYDTAKSNLRFEIDKDNSYVDFRDGGEMGDLGQRIPIDVAFGPGSTPNPSEVEIIEGPDGEKWARITESRSDGPGYVDDAFPNSGQVSLRGKNIMLETDLAGSRKAFDIYYRCFDRIR